MTMHVPDEDLIRAADGELPARRGAAVRAHLDACWTCRERLKRLEDTIGRFVRARQEETLPAQDAARATLRARLSQEETGSRPAFGWGRVAWAGACFVCAVALTPLVLQTTVNAGPRPKADLTPGEIRPIELAEVCRTGQAQVVVRDIPEDTQRRVFAAYGISPRAGEFEVDYLITPDLGGAESDRNIWPQPYSTKWNARVKDRLEQRLHQLVCDGKLDLATAQHDIAADWIGAYRKYLGE
jgi:hypothetical protein